MPMLKRKMPMLKGILLLATAAASTADVLDYDFRGRGEESAIADVFARVLGTSVHDLPFVFEIDPEHVCSDKPEESRSDLCYELTSLISSDSGPSILVRGTSGPDVAYGAAMYCRTYVNMSFSWDRSGGVNDRGFASKVKAGLASWPALREEDEGTGQWRLRDISYGMNVCTHSYSHVWYQFESAADNFMQSWETYLDWMVLSGINLHLAYTGQEEVYRKVYNGFGIDDDTFASWSNGPAHLTWSRGQSMHGVGGPLPREFMTRQWELQRKILARSRELGIVPVLPAFQGNVPPAMADLYPDANITVQSAHWGGGSAAWLDSTDPLFQSIGDAVMAQIIADFGIDVDNDGKGDVTEHWYEADGLFTSGDPPWRRLMSFDERSSADIRPAEADGKIDHESFIHARHAYLAMNATDPAARWLYQGWIWNNDEYDANKLLQVMAAFKAAVPGGRLLVSDMWSEWAPISESLAETGLPYLWGSLQNFGGTLFLGMSVNVLFHGAEEDPAAVPSVQNSFETYGDVAAGVGAFPEGIDQNPAYFRAQFDANWAWSVTASASMPEMWQRYAVERYGFAESAAATAANEAWQILGETVYGVDERANATEGGFYREKAKGGLLNAPLLNNQNDVPSHNVYNMSKVIRAWQLLTDAAAAAAAAAGDGAAVVASTLSYDIVNVGRQCLDSVADLFYSDLVEASSLAEAQQRGRAYMELMADADELLCTDTSFLASAWMRAAREVDGADGPESDFYEAMARAQVTTWLPACASSDEFKDGVCSMHYDDQEPPLEDYASKAWAGMVKGYYAQRVQCYLDEALLPSNDGQMARVNVTSMLECIDQLNRNFQGDSITDDDAADPTNPRAMCLEPVGDVVALSNALISKYSSLMPRITALA